MKGRRRILLFTALGLMILVLVAVVSGVLVFRSQWFRNIVRERAVQELEKATGTRVAFDHFAFDWEGLHASVFGLVLHGNEQAGRAPLFQAKSVTVGLKVVSILKKDVDLVSLTVDAPEIHIYVAPDGSTNLPGPKISSGGSPVGRFLALKVGRFAIQDGTLEYDSRKIPLNVRGDRLKAEFFYDAAGPRYRGEISSRQVRIASPWNEPAAFDLDASLAIEKERLRVERARLATHDSTLQLSGNFESWTSPRGEFELKAALSVAELGRLLRLPLAPRGTVDFDGTASLREVAAERSLSGKVSGRGLAYRNGNVALNGIDFSGRLQATPAHVLLSAVSLSALGASYSGRVQVDGMRQFHAAGDLKGLEIREAAKFVSTRPFLWGGVASGSLSVSGAFAGGAVRGLHLESALDIARGAGDIPIDGKIQAAYDQATGLLRLGESYIETASSRVEASGTPGDTLRITAQSSNLNDVLPVVEFAGTRLGGQIPVALRGGEAKFDGTARGPLADPEISGQLSVTSFRFAEHDFDRLTADFGLTRNALNLHSFNLRQGSAQMDGSGRLALSGWQLQDAGSLQASVNLRDARIETLLAEIGVKAPVMGVASATVKLAGTRAAPQASVRFEANQLSIEGQRFDRARAEIRYAAHVIDIDSAEIDLGRARVELAGSYRSQSRAGGEDWANGELAFHTRTQGLDITQIGFVANARPGLGGLLDLDATGSGKISDGTFDPAAVNGRVALRSVSLDRRTVGGVQLAVTSQDGKLNVEASGAVDQLKFTARGAWRLGGDYQGEAQIQLPRTSFDALRELAASGGAPAQLPFQGFVEARATVAGPLTKPEEFRGQMTLSAIEIQPTARQVRFAARAQDLIVKNAAPVVIQFDRKQARVVSARFTAKDTNLEVAGTVGFDPKVPWNLRVRGGVNLAILQILNPALLGQGNATMDATIRGSLAEPQVNGSMRLRGASLYLSDLTSGVDNANGVVLFDQGRATIESLTAELGGGKISLAGFVGFGGPGAPLLYRLQGNADRCRIRTPEGVSVSVSADLSLTGTSDNSLVSGAVTVVRASFNPRTDIGALIAQATKPTQASSTPREYLRGMQFDVRLESSPSLELQTSLARNIQVEMDLRLRGSPTRPVLLGDVSVNEGEIEIFGNKYTISRGDIRFLNPVKIEPVFDVDVETRARAIDVNISFSGTLSRLNVTYRSDPPLQASEILALLAVGRDPNSTLGLANSQVAAQSSFLQSGANTLLGQAISQQLSSRLQRFFGVSRVKIDPLLTGVYNTPQARLTVEQQVSKDITMTYVTNLTGTQSQIVQIEWALSTHWSATAVRDENGVFGIDFQYKKRLK